MVSNALLVALVSATLALPPPLPGTDPIPDQWGREIEAGPEGWNHLVLVYFEAEDVDRVICLMGHESGGDPGARNPTSGASGLMQVMPFWAGRFGYAKADLDDPRVNLWISRQIRDQQGWVAWSPYLRGECR